MHCANRPVTKTSPQGTHTCICSAMMSLCTRRLCASMRKCRYTLLSMSRACLGLKARFFLLDVLLCLPLRRLRLLLRLPLPDLRLDLRCQPPQPHHHGGILCPRFTVQLQCNAGQYLDGSAAARTSHASSCSYKPCQCGSSLHSES